MRLFLLALLWAPLNAQITASFSDQGAAVIHTITGHKPPKNTTLIAINVCSSSPSQLTTSASRVFMAIENSSRQKPRIVDPTIVGLVLTTYGTTGPAARLAAIGKSATQSGAILIAAKAITATAGWGLGLQIGTQILENYLSTLPPTSNLINIGQDLLSGDIVLSPGGCKPGLAIAGTIAPLTNEQVSVP